MSTEQIIFLVLALAFSIFSMYMKSKKQKQQSSPKTGESYHDFPQEQNSYETLDPVVIFEQFDVTNSPQCFNIATKKNQKAQKTQNVKTTSPQIKTLENVSQSVGLENDNVLLEDFEGTELQRAFLFSEIFKKSKN